MKPIQWKAPSVPRVVVCIVPHDGKGNILFMHRTELVRSARNVWGFPTGLHELGESMVLGSQREMREEYGLETHSVEVIGVYENIAGDDPELEQYHWVLVMLAAECEDLNSAVNKEPDKHDQFKIIPATELMSNRFLEAHPMHSALAGWVDANIKSLLDAVFPPRMPEESFEESEAAQAIALCGRAAGEAPAERGEP